jgi:hypothetical protein
MAKLTPEEIEEIVKRDAPGHRVVPLPPQADAIPRATRSDEGTPDAAAIREKYGQQGGEAHDGESAGAPAADAPAGEEETEDTMIAIAPDSPSSPWAHGSRPKVVVISGKDRKIIASQG